MKSSVRWVEFDEVLVGGVQTLSGWSLNVCLCIAGKLEMQIPWKRLTKDPLVITIDEVYIIVGPNIGKY